MFPRLREQLGVALDLVVEFSTLGEYRLAMPGTPGDQPIVPAAALEPAPPLGGFGRQAGNAAVRRAVPSGAAALRSHCSGAPATPAARRRALERHAGATATREPLRTQGSVSQSRRPGAPAAAEQLCFAGL